MKNVCHCRQVTDTFRVIHRHHLIILAMNYWITLVGEKEKIIVQLSFRNYLCNNSMINLSAIAFQNFQKR